MDESLQAVLCVVLVLLSALFSGLTLGLLGLDVNGLQVVIGGGSPEAPLAAKILPLRRSGNLLLCTLLLGNVAVNAAFSILLSNLTSELVGFLISTIAIVIGGEIVPQSVCSRYALQIGAVVVPVVRFIMVLLYPLAWPLSKALDYMLGEELGTIYDKNELRTLVQMHEMNQGANLRKEEAEIMAGALEIADKQVRDVMTMKEDCYFIDVQQKLDFATLTEIFQAGFSRIPCTDKRIPGPLDIVGLLFVKDLILVDPENPMPVETILNVYGRRAEYVFPDTSLLDMLKLFKETNSHMALVHDVYNHEDADPTYELEGLITLEDIIEVILQDEIVDETDRDDVDATGRFDMSKLNIFHHHGVTREETTRLTQTQFLAAFHHLAGTQPKFLFPSPLSHDALATMLREAVVESVLRDPLKQLDRYVSVQQREQQEQDKTARMLEEGGWALYRAGEPSQYVTLILEGRVTVYAGKNRYESTIGSWNLLALDALDDLSAPYYPDFTAVAATSLCVVRIRREAYKAAVEASAGVHVVDVVHGVSQ